MIGFDEGLKETVGWYLQHTSWWNRFIDDIEPCSVERELVD
jgi:dTDP-D-glucose 4,6-dehydratase